MKALYIFIHRELKFDPICFKKKSFSVPQCGVQGQRLKLDLRAFFWVWPGADFGCRFPLVGIIISIWWKEPQLLTNTIKIICEAERITHIYISIFLTFFNPPVIWKSFYCSDWLEMKLDLIFYYLWLRCISSLCPRNKRIHWYLILTIYKSVVYWSWL